MKKGVRLGIDLGGTRVKLALIDEKGKIHATAHVDTVFNPRKLFADLRDAVRPWLKRKLLGTGVGVAGDVDSTAGVVRISPNLKWNRVPLKKLLEKAGFPRPVVVDNDANAAAWGAYHVELKGRPRNLVVLTLGTGVGGGLILDGKLFRGATGSAGEPGHITLDPHGTKCGCGGRGCLETFLGKKYLIAWMRRELIKRGRPVPKGLTPLSIGNAARKGDKLSLKLWEQAGRALGIGLSDIINLLNPDTILLTGGIAGSFDLLIRSARPEIQARTFATPRRAVRIRVSSENQHLGVIGSALLVE